MHLYGLQNNSKPQKLCKTSILAAQKIVPSKLYLYNHLYGLSLPTKNRSSISVQNHTTCLSSYCTAAPIFVPNLSCTAYTSILVHTLALQISWETCHSPHLGNRSLHPCCKFSSSLLFYSPKDLLFNVSLQSPWVSFTISLMTLHLLLDLKSQDQILASLNQQS